MPRAEVSTQVEAVVSVCNLSPQRNLVAAGCRQSMPPNAVGVITLEGIARLALVAQISTRRWTDHAEARFVRC
jgi:hypothetical protein